MSYTVQQLATLAKVSVRTLHYYDEVGLLNPSRVKQNGYRFYEEKELLRLQQILFFRELDFSLEEIKEILNARNFDMRKALQDQKKLIELKKKRLTSLIKTIDQTIKKINKKNKMEDKDLYGGFSKEEMEEYAKEAKERWGNTKAYKESQERYGKLTKEEKLKIQKDADELMKEIAGNMDKSPKSPEVQKLISRHYNNLRNFYEPSLEMYRGLAKMYVDDSRFTAYFEKYRKGLAVFMRDAIYAYCDSKE